MVCFSLVLVVCLFVVLLSGVCSCVACRLLVVVFGVLFVVCRCLVLAVCCLLPVACYWLLVVCCSHAVAWCLLLAD